MKFALRALLLLVLSVLTGVVTARAVVRRSANGGDMHPEVRLAGAMAGLFAGGAAGLLAGLVMVRLSSSRD